ncbi:MAG: hypothetical protein AAF432_13145 [Planctomycetota bacterium]
MRTIRTCAVAVHRAIMHHRSALLVIAALSTCIGAVVKPAYAGGVGACCLTDGTCLQEAPNICTLEIGGTFLGVGVPCDPNPCVQPEACPGGGNCFEDNDTPGCEDEACCDLICELDLFCCTNEWDELCVDAALKLCEGSPIFGACCFADGSCSIGTEDDCAASVGGRYQGDATVCIPNSCPTEQACCLANGVCMNLIPNDCTASGGVSQGIDTMCDDGTFVCPQIGCPGTGDCFVDNGTPGCEDITCCSAVCILDSFCCTTSWDGVCASLAVDNPFCINAACCLPDDSCVVTIEPDCTAMGGMFQADDDVCKPNPCTPAGACCFVSGICTDDVTVAECNDLGGAFEGDGTACNDGTTSCQNPVCPGTGDCLENNGSVGCDNAACCNLLCTIDPFCCETTWDALCAKDAEFVCTLLPCPWDCAPANGDGTFGNGVVNVDDIVTVIVEFGSSNMECDSAPDNMDGTFGNGTINVDDLVDTIVNFGDCP